MVLTNDLHCTAFGAGIDCFEAFSRLSSIYLKAGHTFYIRP